MTNRTTTERSLDELRRADVLGRIHLTASAMPMFNVPKAEAADETVTIDIDAERWPGQPAYVHVNERGGLALLQLRPEHARELAAALLHCADAAEVHDRTPLPGDCEQVTS